MGSGAIRREAASICRLNVSDDAEGDGTAARRLAALVSVFPAAGHANPTLMLVALSMRLADHLQERLAEERRPLPGSQPSRQVS